MEILTYIDRGGPIMWILLGMSVIGVSLMLWKSFELMLAKKASSRYLASLLEQTEHGSELALELAKKELESHVRNYERGLSTIKIIATTSPLLGLLGTVIGVFMAFEAIQVQGMGEPGIFAGGISLALLTTIAGLIVAIPHTIGYNLFIRMIDRLEDRLELELAHGLMQGEIRET